MFKNGFIFIAILSIFLIAPTSTLPPIGQIIWLSQDERSALVTGCLLTYDKDARKLKCADPITVISYEANDILTYKGADHPTLECLSDGKPCNLLFNDNMLEIGQVNFVLPTQPLFPSSILIHWRDYEGSSGNPVDWRIDWCKYGAGEPQCVIDDIDTLGVSDSSNGENLIISSIDISSLEWSPLDHIAIDIFRDYNSSGDTLSEKAAIENIQIEFKQKRD